MRRQHFQSFLGMIGASQFLVDQPVDEQMWGRSSKCDFPQLWRCALVMLNSSIFQVKSFYLVGSTPIIFVVCGGKILNAVRKEPCGVLSTQWAAEHLGASDHRISHLHVLPRLGRKCGAESFFGSISSKNEFNLQVKRVFFFPFIFLWLRWPKY